MQKLLSFEFYSLINIICGNFEHSCLPYSRCYVNKSTTILEWNVSCLWCRATVLGRAIKRHKVCLVVSIGLVFRIRNRQTFSILILISGEILSLKYSLFQGLRSTYRRCRFWQKNNLFRWSSFWSWQTGKIVVFGAQKTRTHILKSQRTQNESLLGVNFDPEP